MRGCSRDPFFQQILKTTMFFFERFIFVCAKGEAARTVRPCELKICLGPEKKMESAPNVSSYRRVNHMRGWLARLQVRTRTRVPLEVVWAVQDALPDHWQLSYDIVIQTLYRLRLLKHVEHGVQVLCRISGLAPIALDARTEEHVLFLFCCVAKAFEKCQPRQSFFPFSYVGFKLLQLLGVDASAFVPDPRHTARHRGDEDVWRQICLDLGWLCIPFPAV